MAIRTSSGTISKARRLLRRGREWLPTLCLACHRPLCRSYSLCRECEAELPWLVDACDHCGEELADPAASATCPRCRLDPPGFESCYAPLAYRPPVDKWIVDFKFNANFASGYVLSRILARAMRIRWSDGKRPDLLLPTPLHRSKLRQRGFNQALEIAKVLAAETGIPLQARSLRKSRATAPQTRMQGARKRSANVRSSFELESRQALGNARRIALVDDVVTTMSTVRELSRVLKRAGVEEVEVCCLARAGP